MAHRAGINDCEDCNEKNVCEVQNMMNNYGFRCKMFSQRRPLSNADRLRAMADEELAEFAVSTGQGCAPGKNFVECCFDHKDWLAEADCRKCWLGWLKEEATDDNHDH